MLLFYAEYGDLDIDVEDRVGEQHAQQRRSRERCAKLVRETAARHRNRLVWLAQD
ncbi:hypothetical protein RMN57_33565 [Kitasatospora sp. CM 4170]|uniref:Uncharacterized protein n=1 Tax=Kitasatospora aburaviensis TaxID=67265 RepID=A0ABW1F6Q6_9ACTN|nr:hypothetical protein [Kitasatospora sp. CM 4170]WNM49273.1 hypothetical protein RMN57_33565 [Kitasatospora sp. CM 4170]